MTIDLGPHVLVDPLRHGDIHTPTEIVGTELEAGRPEVAGDQDRHGIEAPRHEDRIDHDLQEPEEPRARQGGEDGEDADEHHRRNDRPAVPAETPFESEEGAGCREGSHGNRWARHARGSRVAPVWSDYRPRRVPCFDFPLRRPASLLLLGTTFGNPAIIVFSPLVVSL